MDGVDTYPYQSALVRIAPDLVMGVVGDPILVGEDVEIRLVIDDMSTQAIAERAASATKALVSSAPVGAIMAAFVIHDQLGDTRLAHPDAWALVDDDLALFNLAGDSSREENGLAGQPTLEALLAALAPHESER